MTTRLLELLVADADERSHDAWELKDLCRWVVRDDFDRRSLNRRLASLPDRSTS